MLGALRDVRAGQTVLDLSIVNSLIARREGVPIDDLTAREIVVLELMAHGLTNRAVASELGLSVKAVEKYVIAIFRKLELVDDGRVDRRVAAALTYLRAQTDPLGTGHRGSDPAELIALQSGREDFGDQRPRPAAVSLSRRRQETNGPTDVGSIGSR